MQDVRVFGKAGTGQTDHYPLVSKVEVELKKIPKRTRKPAFDTSKLPVRSLREECNLKLHMKFQALHEHAKAWEIERA